MHMHMHVHVRMYAYSCTCTHAQASRSMIDYLTSTASAASPPALVCAELLERSCCTMLQLIATEHRQPLWLPGSWSSNTFAARQQRRPRAGRRRGAARHSRLPRRNSERTAGLQPTHPPQLVPRTLRTSAHAALHALCTPAHGVDRMQAAVSLGLLERRRTAARRRCGHARLGLVAMERAVVVLLTVLLNRLKLDSPFSPTWTTHARARPLLQPPPLPHRTRQLAMPMSM